MLFALSLRYSLQPDSSQTLVRGLVLLNCAGGMNNKAIVDDWRIKLILPLLWLVDFLLKQKGIASAIFERVKERYPLGFIFDLPRIEHSNLKFNVPKMQREFEEHFVIRLCK